MGATFRLGRIAGVPVGVHWSVVAIFGLIAWMLAAVRFPDVYPGEPGWAYAAAGLAAAVVFFAGLLAHEVSHAVVAQRNGIEVEDITLWLFGGVARLKGEASTPGADLRIAGIGPLVSLVIGLAFGLVTLVLVASGAEGLTVGALAWLAGINVLLAVFNVLPAAPLDGGRVLRAALWRWRGDRTWAAIVSAQAGRVLGLVLIAVGLAQFLATGATGSLWLALIGWFLLGAAAQEEQQARFGVSLAGVRVRDVMTAHPETLPPSLTVADFVERELLTRRHSTFPLVEDGHPVGLVTLRRMKAVPEQRRRSTVLREIACTGEDLAVVRPDEPLLDVVPRLNQCADGRALVVENGTLLGIVSRADVTRALEQASLRRQEGASPAGRRPTDR